MNKRILPALVFPLFLMFAHFCIAQSGSYQALFAPTAPKMDGDTNDNVWKKIATWNTYHQVWLNNVGTSPTSKDFSWKFKLAWDKDRFYILAVITDDVLSDRTSNPLDRYYEDDTFEVFFDEDNSGGQHERSFQAFAYHVSLKYDIVDSDNTGAARLLNDHAQVRMDTVDGKYVWEAAFKVFPSTFTINNPGLPVTLSAGKKMGWGLAYCDNDGKSQRDHFFGSETVDGTNKNVAYINADVFGTVELVNPNLPVVPTFSHVLVDNGLTKPTAMRIAPNGDIYVCEQTGGLKVLREGVLHPTNLINVDANTSGPSNTERGLLGLALDPNFDQNHFIYLYYTTSEGYVHNRVSRFTLNGTNNVTNTEVKLTELDSLSEAAIHNGGAMHFGRDGKLYVATGENATPSNSQDLGSTHGKLLRINQDGTVPRDNPFFGASGADPRIWSYGLRNPFTFDISTTGQILLNDVGYESWEEIDDASQPGKNYGWPLYEGPVVGASFQKPLYTYPRVLSSVYTDSTGCAITGGTFFEPLATNYPQEYVGKYFFMDYCSKWINMIDPLTGSGRKTFATNVPNSPIAIDHHPDGNLYYLARGNGSIYKITYSGQPKPVITREPKLIEVMVGQILNVQVVVGGEAPLTYLWKKNGQVLSGATTSQFIITNAQFSDSGVYVLTITNAYGVGETKPIRVKVLEYNTPPIVTIAPVSDPTFYGGQSYTLKGTATDQEQGILSGSAYTWSVDLYHGSHIHDGIPVAGNETMQFTVPIAGGHTETDIFYRITLIAKDAKGLTDTAYVDLYPELVDIVIISEPSGFQFTLDGTPFTAPYTFRTVKGIRRRLGTVGPQSLANTQYLFDSWSHSVDSVNSIEPMQAGSYTVRYVSSPVTDLQTLETKAHGSPYPNPFTDSFIVDVQEPGRLIVTDALGQVIESVAVQQGKNKVQPEWQSGLYFLIYESTETKQCFKMMKK